VRELARTYTTEDIEALVGVMRDVGAPPAARVTASTAILDRGYLIIRQRAVIARQRASGSSTECLG
jgi:hypothetical protein